PALFIRPTHLPPRHCRVASESCSQLTIKAGLFQQPALMIAVKDLFQGDYSGVTGRSVMWTRKVGDGT
ncbi:hypothetical protein, partial [Paracoccus sp. JM45]|uniref:hypothetical protein n=1 Tax=Paracoccus sp. JM45 TaxID=2283626 RepID=UPI001C727F5E